MSGIRKYFGNPKLLQGEMTLVFSYMINSHNSIQSKWHFMDLNLTICNGRIEFNVFRKPTHTDRIIDNDSQNYDIMGNSGIYK